MAVSKTKTPETETEDWGPKTHSKTKTLENENQLVKRTITNGLVRSCRERGGVLQAKTLTTQKLKN